jgi:PTS system nitrogen regulatory IIA component
MLKVPSRGGPSPEPTRQPSAHYIRAPEFRRCCVDLNVREAARLLRVSAQTIYRLIYRENLPAHRRGDQYQFNRVELEEWSRRHAVPEDGPRERAANPSLRRALRHGGIHYGVEADDRDSALRTFAALPGDRVALSETALYETLLAREELAPTTVGGGFALPHPRDPIVSGVEIEVVHLCFFAKPVDFGALDGQRVHTALLLLSPGVEMHIQLLALTAFALRDGELCRDLIERVPPDVILRRLDTLLKPVESRRS